jgi:hypothetical protein
MSPVAGHLADLEGWLGLHASRNRAGTRCPARERGWNHPVRVKISYSAGGMVNAPATGRGGHGRGQREHPARDPADLDRLQAGLTTLAVG